MAQRRMTSLEVIDTDAFLEMPVSSQLLYFHLNSRADDDGFVSNPRKIARAVGAAEDDLKILVSKKFLIVFDDGVVVIKHWRINNFVRKDIYKETKYLDHRQALLIRGNGAYTLTEDNRAIKLPRGHFNTEDVDVSLTTRQLRLGKGSIDKDREDKNRLLSEAPLRTVSENEEEIPKPRSRAKYPHSKEVFALWGKYPRLWERNTTICQAAEDIYSEIGMEDAKYAICDFYPKNKDKPFCPQFNDPHEFLLKYKKLEAFSYKV